MAKINIKSPQNTFTGNKTTSTGEFNGEPGYQKRTPSPNAVPEKTYEKQQPQPLTSIKTPGEKSTKM